MVNTGAVFDLLKIKDNDNNDNDNKDNIDFFDFFTPGSYNPPTNTHYTQIQCSVKPENIGRLIGNKGKAFNAITRCARIKYLWIDNDRNVIEIWGPERRLADAKLRLIERMNRIESNPN